MTLNRSRVSMRVNAALIVRLRKERSWSQDELAVASGLNLRTIQRIENDAQASLQSKKALAAALEIDTRDLETEGVQMTPCPVCRSNEIYRYKDYFPNPGSAGGETLLPGLGKLLASAEICPTVCHGCGYVRVFASEAARKKLATSKDWRRVDA
jgi:transcriptional regulator with XRE-family HTH domain